MKDPIGGIGFKNRISTPYDVCTPLTPDVERQGGRKNNIIPSNCHYVWKLAVETGRCDVNKMGGTATDVPHIRGDGVLQR